MGAAILYTRYGRSIDQTDRLCRNSLSGSRKAEFFLGSCFHADSIYVHAERICDILMDQGFQVPEEKGKMALLYRKEDDFGAVMQKAAALRENYTVSILPQAKKLGKQLGTLEAQGFSFVAFADNDDIKTLGEK